MQKIKFFLLFELMCLFITSAKKVMFWFVCLFVTRIAQNGYSWFVIKFSQGEFDFGGQKLTQRSKSVFFFGCNT